MTASFFRMTSPTPVKTAFRASVKADPGESDLCLALSEAEHQLDSIGRTIVFRVDSDVPAATHVMLDDMRRIADRIKAAADAYQYGVRS